MERWSGGGRPCLPIFGAGPAYNEKKRCRARARGARGARGDRQQEGTQGWVGVGQLQPAS